jgi:hypothetical protein
VLVVFNRRRPDQSLFFFRKSENLSTCDEDDDGVDETDDAEDDDESQRRIGVPGCEPLLLLELRLRLRNISLASRPKLTWLIDRWSPLIEEIDWFLVTGVIGVAAREAPILWYPSSLFVLLHSTGFLRIAFDLLASSPGIDAGRAPVITVRYGAVAASP